MKQPYIYATPPSQVRTILADHFDLWEPLGWIKRAGSDLNGKIAIEWYSDKEPRVPHR